MGGKRGCVRNVPLTQGFMGSFPESCRLPIRGRTCHHVRVGCPCIGRRHVLPVCINVAAGINGEAFPDATSLSPWHISLFKELTCRRCASPATRMAVLPKPGTPFDVFESRRCGLQEADPESIDMTIQPARLREPEAADHTIGRPSLPHFAALEQHPSS
jgi:hypothetical protein